MLIEITQFINRASVIKPHVHFILQEYDLVIKLASRPLGILKSILTSQTLHKPNSIIRLAKPRVKVEDEEIKRKRIDKKEGGRERLRGQWQEAGIYGLCRPAISSFPPFSIYS